MGGRAYPSTVDVSDTDALETAAENVVREHGRIDILVCNAGILHPSRLYKIQHHEIEQLMAVNFLSIVQLTKFFLKKMIEQGDGHIVCISVNTPLISSLNKYFKYLKPRDASTVAKRIVSGVRTYKQFIHIPSSIRLMSFINFLSPITFNNLIFDFVFKEKFDPVQPDEKFDSY